MNRNIAPIVFTVLSVMTALSLPTQSALAVDLATGINTNIQVWTPASRDALIDQLATSKVKVIRASFHSPRPFYYDMAKRLYDKGIKMDLMVGPSYMPGANLRAKSKLRDAYPLSQADPELTKKDVQDVFDNLDKEGVVLEGVELDNEFNWADFNGDFPVPGQGKVFDYNDLSKDSEAKTVAKGFLQYLKCLAVLKEVRDHSQLNKNTPIVLGGLVYFNGWPPPSMKLDGVQLDATLKFLKANGLDKYVDVYGVHCYPKEETPEKRKQDVDACCSNYGKPIWITEWGVMDGVDEKKRAELEKEVMHYFRSWAHKNILQEVIYFSWNYYGPKTPNPVFRDGKLQPVGKAALGK